MCLTCKAQSKRRRSRLSHCADSASWPGLASSGGREILLAGTAVLLLAPVLLAGAGVSMVVCLVVLMFVPVVTVVGYETAGTGARTIRRPG